MEGGTPLNINHQVKFDAYVNEILKSRLSASGLKISYLQAHVHQEYAT